MKAEKQGASERTLIRFHKRDRKRLTILSSVLFPNKGYLIHYKLGREDCVAFVGFVGETGRCKMLFSTTEVRGQVI